MNKLVNATIIVIITTLLSKILGFVRELILAFAYGTSIYTDAYLTAMNIPSVIFLAIGTALSTTYIPLYYQAEEEQKGNGDKFCSNIINLVSILSIILSILGIFFTKPIVKIFAIGFEGEVLGLTIHFTRILMLGILFMSLNNIMIAMLQSKGNFKIPGLIGIPYNIIIIFSILLSMKTQIEVMIWGTLIATITQVLFQLPFVIKGGYKYEAYVDINEKYIQKMIVLIGPVFIGVFANQLNVIIDKTLASQLGEGILSALNYANKLNLFVIGIFISSLSVVIYPTLSKLSLRQDNDGFRRSIEKSMNMVSILIIPITMGAIVLSKPIVKMLFERGQFDSTATEITSLSLICYSIGLLGIGFNDLLKRIFYSLKDTKTPMINSVISIIFNIILNIILVKFMGYIGLPLATSVSCIITTILLFISLNKKVGYFGQKEILKTMLKSTIASIIMSICTYLSYNIFIDIFKPIDIYEIISLFGAIVIGIFIYLILVFILKLEETKFFIEAIIEVKQKYLKRRVKQNDSI